MVEPASVHLAPLARPPLCKASPDGLSSRAVSQWDVAQQSGSWAGGLEGGKRTEGPAAGLSVTGPEKLAPSPAQ